ncbi:MAG: acyl-CoA dehydrogenase [Wenzhouxiangellaceae bacterium]
MSSFYSRRDLDFILNDLLNVSELCAYPRYAEHDEEVFREILDTAEKLASERFLPHAAKSDANPPVFDDGRAILIPEIGEAVEAFCENGFIAASFGPEHGGLGLPETIAQAATSIFMMANLPSTAYGTLTIGAARLIESFGSDEQRQRYLLPMVEGRFFGTMCLSETHAGSSLTDIRTRAEPQDDGSYRLFGNKMWISAGEHELSENIIHMVLAKLPDAPPGVKGISLFLVPRSKLNEAGEADQRNDVVLAGLNHKMGYHGSVNTVLNFGDNGGAYAELIGEPHQGLVYMFQMMNEARISVGLSAAALSVAGYRAARDYAMDRRQGRHPDNKDPSAPMVPIIEHADVKRMLLQAKSYAEGGLALCLFAARLMDDSRVQDEAAARQAFDLLDLLTPIVKSWPSEFGLKANDLAIQVHGGYGYTKDYPVERLYRDNRLNSIHEGAKGIHGIDLLGRKVLQNGGQALELLLEQMAATVKAVQADEQSETMQWMAGALDEMRQTVMTTSTSIMGQVASKGITACMANATIYLDMLGHVTVAWLWLRQAHIASQRLASNDSASDESFLRGKLAACEYFYRYELPQAETQCRLLARVDDTCLNTDPAWF